MAKPDDPDAPLKRLGGGRWQTRDERFTIEPQSGTWVVVDGEQTDDLGLPLVRGPFGSLGAAKDAIAAAREAAPATSPIAAKVAATGERGGRPASTTTAAKRERSTTRAAGSQGARPSATGPEDAPGSDDAPQPEDAPGSEDAPRPEPAPEPEPRWLAALAPVDRRRAKRLIERLTELGAADPEGIARRDVVGAVPAAAAFAIERALDGLGEDASPDRVAELLANGRDDGLGVRWRLVDDDDRPITLDLEPGRRRR